MCFIKIKKKVVFAKFSEAQDSWVVPIFDERTLGGELKIKVPMNITITFTQ